MLYSIKIVLPQFFLIIGRARPKSVKWLMFHWVNLSGIKLDRINKATALYHLRDINHQNRVRVCRYSYWLFCKISVISLMSKNTATRFMTKAIAGDQFWKTQIPHMVLKISLKNWLVWEIGGKTTAVFDRGEGNQLWLELLRG